MSELLKYNRSNPNLRSQIISNNNGGRSGGNTERIYDETMTKLNESIGEVKYGSLSRVNSEPVLPLPTLVRARKTAMKFTHISPSSR